MQNFLASYKNAAIILLSSLYITGIILFNKSTTQAFALAFTPVHLLLSTAILLSFHQNWQNRQIIILGAFCCAFWAIEWLGVHTDFPFGPYHYGPVLGWQFANVPLLIGINWIIYLYSINVVMQTTHWPAYLKIIVGASILVILDIFIEPVAIHFNFWRWQTEDGQPPLANYISWWCLSVIALIIFNISIKNANSLAWIFLLWQFGFFAILNILIY